MSLQLQLSLGQRQRRLTFAGLNGQSYSDLSEQNTGTALNTTQQAAFRSATAGLGRHRQPQL
ncbi:MAG: hypothetical protein U1E47_03645 [Rivihabitans pingtungensis]